MRVHSSLDKTQRQSWLSWSRASVEHQPIEPARQLLFPMLQRPHVL